MAFTIGLSKTHPDVQYSKLIAEKFPSVIHKIYIPKAAEIKVEERSGDLPGDAAIRLFYKFAGKYTDSIIAGDGIDEFMCGYYGHQMRPGEKMYYHYLRRLKNEHLIPLDNNSGDIKVYLPFLNDRLLHLLAQIPTFEKVNMDNRKKIMLAMAKGRIPDEIITRRKYGFCDAFKIKGEQHD